MPERFAVFILTHGRPDKVLTYASLRRQGYTGPIYLIVDDEDETLPEYRRRYGEQVVIFSKQAVADVIDEGDNFKERRAILYARNASFGIAEDLGLDYFLQFDDDYIHFEYRVDRRHQTSDDGGYVVRSGMDSIINAYLDYYRVIPALSIATGQGGDFYGGNTPYGKPLRKCMNSFFCSTRRPFQFVGKVNEDVNTYTSLQRRSGLFLTVPFVTLHQPLTQSNAGGMTGLYLDQGTYRKSFYSVMYAPSCVRIRMMGATHRRPHHAVTWDNAAPRIIREVHRKASALAASRQGDSRAS